MVIETLKKLTHFKIKRHDYLSLNFFLRFFSNFVFFWVSSLAYPNLLGKKGYAVVVVVVVFSNFIDTFLLYKQGPTGHLFH